MLACSIKQEAKRLKVKYRTDDPYEICDAMDIMVMLRSMGRSPNACKGFYLVNNRCKLVVINSDLPEWIRRIIHVHELGHAVLHSDSSISAYHDFNMLDNTDRMEYEANLFAAEFLLDDDEVMDALKEGRGLYQVAQHLYVPPELLDFKLRVLQREGVEIAAPYFAHGDFLKRDLGQPSS